MELERALSAVHPSWLSTLEGLPLEKILGKLGPSSLPETSKIFAALKIPKREVKVLILGQDPYPTPGHPIGLAFAVDEKVKPLPRSLSNIFKELQDDIGGPLPESGDLNGWVEQGVLLLNRALSVEAGQAGSHRAYGWAEVTEKIVEDLQEDDEGFVSILWGLHAQELEGKLSGPVIKSAHPSPLSARRGFFGSKPFSRTNQLLGAMGRQGIDWNHVNPTKPFS